VAESGLVGLPDCWEGYSYGVFMPGMPDHVPYAINRKKIFSGDFHFMIKSSELRIFGFESCTMANQHGTRKK
jgi:hypothetical protein